MIDSLIVFFVVVVVVFFFTILNYNKYQSWKMPEEN